MVDRGRNVYQFLLFVDQLAGPDGATIESLAEGLQVDRRTVHRYFKLAERLGLPIVEEPFERNTKRFRLPEEFVERLPNLTLPRIDFSLAEMIALYSLKADPNTMRGAEMEEHIAAAFRKLELALPPEMTKRLEQIQEFVMNDGGISKTPADRADMMDTLNTAILSLQTCAIRYSSTNLPKPQESEIDPLRLFTYRGRLYALIREKGSGDTRVLGVDRMISITPTGKCFEEPQEL